MCVLVVIETDLSAVPREVLLDVGVEDSRCLANLLSPENSEADASGKHRLLLEPYGYGVPRGWSPLYLEAN
jgi:hypothetical protein